MNVQRDRYECHLSTDVASERASSALANASLESGGFALKQCRRWQRSPPALRQCLGMARVGKVSISEAARAELLGTGRQMVRVLGKLESRADHLAIGFLHASFEARLALFLCRLEVGDSSADLIFQMQAFAYEYNSYVNVLAPS